MPDHDVRLQQLRAWLDDCLPALFQRHGWGAPPVGELTPASSDASFRRYFRWQAEGRAEVTLYGVIGGGHLLPQAGFRAPRLLGPTLSGFDGPRAIWDFFTRQRPTPAQP